MFLEATEKKKMSQLIVYLLRHESVAKKSMKENTEGENHNGRPRLEFINYILEDMKCY